MFDCELAWFAPSAPVGYTISAVRLAPCALLAFPAVETLKFGANFNDWQDPIWKCVRNRRFRAFIAIRRPREFLRAAVRRVEHELGTVDDRVDRTHIRRNPIQDRRDRMRTRRIRCDPRSAPYVYSTSIRARTTFVPKLNGPATTGVTIDNPNGDRHTDPSDRSVWAVKCSAVECRTGTPQGPDPRTVSLICEEAGQVPSLACCSPQRGTGGDHAGEALGRRYQRVAQKRCCPFLLAPQQHLTSV